MVPRYDQRRRSNPGEPSSSLELDDSLLRLEAKRSRGACCARACAASSASCWRRAGEERTELHARLGEGNSPTYRSTLYGADAEGDAGPRDIRKDDGALRAGSEAAWCDGRRGGGGVAGLARPPPHDEAGKSGALLLHAPAASKRLRSCETERCLGSSPGRTCNAITRGAEDALSVRTAADGVVEEAAARGADGGPSEEVEAPSSDGEREVGLESDSDIVALRPSV